MSLGTALDSLNDFDLMFPRVAGRQPGSHRLWFLILLRLFFVFYAVAPLPLSRWEVLRRWCRPQALF